MMLGMVDFFHVTTMFNGIRRRAEESPSGLRPVPAIGGGEAIT